MNRSSPKPPSLHHAIRIGTGFSFTSQLASQFISVAVLVALYRWVPREDFGLIAAAQLLVMLPRTFLTLGLNIAGIQREQLELPHLRGLFWWNLSLGAIASFVTAICVPLVATWKDSEDLSRIGYALSGTAVVAALGMAHQTFLERELRFPALQSIRLVSQLAAGLIAIAIASQGGGAWALVVQSYLELLFIACGCMRTAWFWPGSPRTMREAFSLLRFGGMYGLVSMLFYLSQNLDKFLLYAFLPNSEIAMAVFGMYQQAFNWMMRPVLGVTTPVSSVMLPALSRVQSDRSLFQKLAIDFYRLVALLLIPCGLGAFLVAEDAMLTAGGQMWRDAGILLRALSPVILLQGFVNISGSVFTASNQLRAMAIAAAWLLVLQTQGLLAGYWFGSRIDRDPLSIAEGMAWGYSITTACVVGLPYLWFCCRMTQVSFASLLKAITTPLWASSVMAVAVWYLNRAMTPDVAAPIRLSAAISLGVAIYGWLARRPLREMIRNFGSA